MCRSAGAKQSAVALKVPIEFSWMRNYLVNDRSRRTVATSISISLLLGEETNVMAFRNDDNSYLGVDL